MFLQVNIVFASMFIGLAYGYGNTTVWDGYPAGFICQEAVNGLPSPLPLCFPFPGPGQPPSYEYVNCTISKNNEVKFNKTVLWGNRMEGYFEDVDESWEKANWLIEASWKGGSFSYTVVTTTKARTELNCLETVHESLKYRVDEFTLDCMAPEYLEFMTKEQYDLVNTKWYKDCQEISRDDKYFKFLEGEFDDKRCGNDRNSFKKLQFINASYEKTPGTYHCELEYKGNILPASSYHLCLTEKYRSANIPTIVRSKNEYIVHPGDDVDVYCMGNTGGRDVLSTISWKRNETELCRSSMNEKTENCSSEEYVIKERCSKLTPAEADAAKIHDLPDNFTAMYTFRNVKYSDSGFYKCNLYTTSGPKTDQFQIIVRDKETRHIAPITTFVSLGACPLTSYEFHQPRQTTDYIRVKTPVPDMFSGTVCAWISSGPDGMMQGTLVSYATAKKFNSFNLFGYKKNGTAKLDVFINDEGYSTDLPLPKEQEVHFCAAFSIIGGYVKIYLGGAFDKIIAGFQKKMIIEGGGVLIIGQEQDGLASGFMQDQSYKGAISNFMMWNRELEPEEIRSMAEEGCECPKDYFAALTPDAVTLSGGVAAKVMKKCPATK